MSEPTADPTTPNPDPSTAPDPAGDAVEPQPERDPEEWVTGDEPSTGPQRSYVATLAQEAGEEIDPAALSKAEASQVIDRLQAETGRGGDS